MRAMSIAMDDKPKTASIYQLVSRRSETRLTRVDVEIIPDNFTDEQIAVAIL